MEYSLIEEWTPELNKVQEDKNKQMKHVNKGVWAIFLDGKDITKHHKYDFLSENSITKQIYETGVKLINKLNIRCHIYAVMDEIIFVFPNISELSEKLKETDSQYILTLFILKFYQLWEEPTILFKGVIYKVGNISKTIESRKVSGYYTALEYFAKEYLNKDLYYNKTPIEIKAALDEKEMLASFEENTAFHDGYYNLIEKRKEGYTIVF